MYFVEDQQASHPTPMFKNLQLDVDYGRATDGHHRLSIESRAASWYLVEPYQRWQHYSIYDRICP